MSEPAVAAAHAIARALQLAGPLVRFSTGSVPVFATADGHVLKLFPEDESSFHDIEHRTLRWLEGRLPFHTPTVRDAGQHGGWHYVVMTRLPGQPLADVIHRLPPRALPALHRSIGRGLAALHALDPAGCPCASTDWPGFLHAQRLTAVARQVEKGLGAGWLDAVDPFLSRWCPDGFESRCVLHTEVMPAHVFVEPDGAGWRMTGLIDFEPAMSGSPEYEFAAVGVFLTRGEEGAFGHLLEGYGRRPDLRFSCRVMACALLHRYSNLPWFLQQAPARGSVGDLETLARQWYG